MHVIIRAVVIKIRLIEQNQRPAEIAQHVVGHVALFKATAPFGDVPLTGSVEPRMQHGKAHQLRVRRRGRVVSFHPGLGEIRQKQIDVAALLLRDGERRAARGLVSQIFRLHKALRIPIFHPRKPVFRRIEINHLSAQRDSGKLGRLHVIRFAQRDIFLALFHNGLIADAHGFRQRRRGCGQHRRRQQSSYPPFHIRFLPAILFNCL